MPINSQDLQELHPSTGYYQGYLGGEVIKSFYYYKETLLIRVESFEFKRRIRSDVDKGYGRPDGCNIYDEDYEKEGAWIVSKIELYKYDKKGRKISTYTPISEISQNRYKYDYDVHGNLITERCYVGIKLFSTITYQHQHNMIISLFHWDYKDRVGSTQMKTFDDHGKLIKDSRFNVGKEWQGIYKYNEEGNLARYTATYNYFEVRTHLTHIYRYKK